MWIVKQIFFIICKKKDFLRIDYSMKKIIYALIAIAVIYGCSKKSQGELIGVKAKKFFPEKPLGMTLVKGSSYIMGMSDYDIAQIQNAPPKTVTVRSFYMDETEITNGEYRQFVNWVRDSVARDMLAERAIEELGKFPTEEQLDDDNSIFQYFPKYDPENTDIADEEKSGYQLYQEDLGALDYNGYEKNYSLNLDIDLIWDREEYPDLAYAQIMEDSIFLPKDQWYNGQRTINTKILKYRYHWFNSEKFRKALLRPSFRDSSKKFNTRKQFFKEEVLKIYPDTTVWIKDFSYSYNEPMHNDYFWHRAFSDYPVVGVSWHQAKAFAHWRTKYKNDYNKSRKNKPSVSNFRLPTEAEWEYAARGGLQSATYPWGGPYIVNDRGCFLANFKPNRGDYAADMALYTVEAKSYEPNDYGLYNMAGNVAEWTESAYDKGSYEFVSSMNPNLSSVKNNRKVVRGGSWKDVAYFLRVSSRDLEYADSSRSYIGFRTVQDYLGSDESQINIR